MTKDEALGCVADGHTFWYVDTAKKICDYFGIKFDDELVTHYEGQADANPNNDPKGLWLVEDKPCDGVNALHLSYFIAKKLGVNTKKNPMTGRGFQAQWNAREVRELLK